MRKNISLPEDELIFQIANKSISFNDFRAKYFNGKSIKYKTAYNNLYNFGLITEDEQMQMKLSKAGNEVYLYSDFEKYTNKCKTGKKNINKRSRTGHQKFQDWLQQYYPQITVILLIFGILISLTLYL